MQQQAAALAPALGTASGTLDFTTGMASGTFNDTSATPPTGSFVGGRR